MTILRLSSLCALCWLLATTRESASAQAQSPQPIAVFPVAFDNAALRQLAGALDPVLVSKLQEMSQVQVVARPALDLSATQLAVDCVGQTPECLRAVAHQIQVMGLIAPSLQLVGDEQVVTLLYFDASTGGEMHTVTRRYAGTAVARQALDDVPSMLNELFSVPEPEAEATPSSTGSSAFDSSLGADYEVPRSTWPTLPVVLTASGIALLGAGLAFGLAAKSAEHSYSGLPITSQMQVDHADRRFSSARTDSVLCNVGMALGGVTLATGATLWIVHLARQPERKSLVLTPQLGLGEYSLALRGGWD